MKGLLKHHKLKVIALAVLLSFTSIQVADAFIPVLMLRLAPGAVRFMQAGIKATGLVSFVAPNMVQIPLPMQRGKSRALQVSLAATSTIAAALALSLGYKATTKAIFSNCKTGISNTLYPTLADGKAAVETYIQTIFVYNHFTFDHWVDAADGLSSVSYVTDSLNPIPFLYSSVNCQSTNTNLKPIEIMIEDLKTNPTQAKTDNLIMEVKKLTLVDFEAISTIIGQPAIQPASDYPSGDSIAVGTDGGRTVNGNLTNTVTYTGKDGLKHTMTFDANGDLLVDGQKSTGYTVNKTKKSTGNGTGTAATTKTSAPDAMGNTTSVTTSKIDNGNCITTTTTVTTVTDSTGGVVSTNSVDKTIMNDPNAANGKCTTSSFDNFGLGVGRGITSSFSPLMAPGTELCFTSNFAGTHCFSEFDKNGIWTNYIRIFMGVIGSLLAIMIPLTVAMRI